MGLIKINIFDILNLEFAEFFGVVGLSTFTMFKIVDIILMSYKLLQGV